MATPDDLDGLHPCGERLGNSVLVVYAAGRPTTRPYRTGASRLEFRGEYRCPRCGGQWTDRDLENGFKEAVRP